MLSFLVPAYNAADVVAEAVQSALAQELDVPFEVVVVDDASTDETAALLEAMTTQDHRLRLHRHEVNRGGGATRNTAASVATGDLLYVVDADNVLLPGTAQAVLDALRRTSAQAASPEIQQFFDGGTGAHRHVWTMPAGDGWSTLSDALTNVAVPAAHGNYLYTRQLFEAVGGYEPDLGAMDTWTFGFKHLARGFDVAIAPSAAYLHRLERPAHDSYWTRAEKAGDNDRHALVGIRRQLEHLSPPLREKVEALEPGDRLFLLVAEGLFDDDVPFEQFRAGLASIRRRPIARTGSRGLLGRLAHLMGR